MKTSLGEREARGFQMSLSFPYLCCVRSLSFRVSNVSLKKKKRAFTDAISKWLLAGSWAMINILLLVLDSDSHVDLHATGL